MNNSINKIISNEASFIIIKDDIVILEDKGIGVSCIRKVLNSNPSILNNSVIVDKIIGKAACMLLIPNKIKHIHALLISENAINTLIKHNISFSYDNKCEFIINRTNDGMCPLETSVLNIEDFDEAKIKIEKTISILMKNKISN